MEYALYALAAIGAATSVGCFALATIEIGDWFFRRRPHNFDG